MSEILEALKAEFEADERKEIEIPEIGMTIYSKPFTIGDRKKLSKQAGDDTYEFVVRALILKAEDKEGNKIFDLSDKIHIMHKVRPSIIERIVTEMGDIDTGN